MKISLAIFLKISRAWEKIFGPYEKGNHGEHSQDEIENGYRYKYNLHAFRRFFYSNFTAMMPANAVAYLMGYTSDPLTKGMHWDAKT